MSEKKRARIEIKKSLNGDLRYWGLYDEDNRLLIGLFGPFMEKECYEHIAKIRQLMAEVEIKENLDG
jgi:hypothetical protein